jgi:hypothetical protein
VWHYFWDYRGSAPYGCNITESKRYHHPYFPLIGRFLFVDSLEVYIGGWIERGKVTVSGDIFHEPLQFEAGARPTMISFSRMGEWYRPEFDVTFRPSPRASCRIQIIYRFRGIY